MIRSSALLVVAAIALLAAGVFASSLELVYVSIGVSILAAVLLSAGVILRRREIFGAAGTARPATTGTPAIGQMARAKPPLPPRTPASPGILLPGWLAPSRTELSRPVRQTAAPSRAARSKVAPPRAAGRRRAARESVPQVMRRARAGPGVPRPRGVSPPWPERSRAQTAS